MISREQENEKLRAVITTFPAEFGLRAYEGVFRISLEKSYVSTVYGMQLYTQKKAADGTWADFAKGSPEQLRGELR